MSWAYFLLCFFMWFYITEMIILYNCRLFLFPLNNTSISPIRLKKKQQKTFISISRNTNYYLYSHTTGHLSYFKFFSYKYHCKTFHLYKQAEIWTKFPEVELSITELSCICLINFQKGHAIYNFLSRVCKFSSCCFFRQSGYFSVKNKCIHSWGKWHFP